jgi:hypothetical protein
MTPKEFLSLLFQDKENSDWFYLWEGPTKNSAWFTDIDKAAKHAAKYKDDLYVGMALAPDPKTLKREKKAPIKHIRCRNNEVVGIPGLYVDIDVRHEVHNKSQLPETMDDALSLVFDNGFDPTLIIKTGYGVHCYWLFKELWKFDNDNERRQAYHLNHRLCSFVRNKAQQRGWTIDSVFDLSRVLRVPDTLNKKNGDARKVEALYPTVDAIQKEAYAFYNPDDLEIFLLDVGDENPRVELPPSVQDPLPLDPVASHDIEKSVSTLDLNPDAQPPLEKMMELQLICDPELKLTWEWRRKDLKDDSPSGYNFALAIMCVQGGWSDQEIVNAMIAQRRKHGKQLKLKNRQYYARTVLEARRRVAEEEADRELADAAGLCGTEYEQEDTRSKGLESLSTKLGVTIKKIIKYDGDDPSFLLITDKGDVALPSVDYIIEGTKLRSKIAAKTGKIITWKKGKWGFFAQLILDLADVQFVSPEAENRGMMTTWLREYISSFDARRLEDVINDKQPFVRDGHWHVFSDRFRRWVGIHKDFKGSETQLQTNMKRVDVERVKYNLYIDELRTSRSAWKIPTEVVRIEINEKDACTE